MLSLLADQERETKGGGLGGPRALLNSMPTFATWPQRATAGFLVRVALKAAGHRTPELMTRLLVLQPLSNLFDEQSTFQRPDRTRLPRFVGLRTAHGWRIVRRPGISRPRSST
jgi:hypothetical protein